MIIEFHDSEVDNERQGSLAGRAGGGGTIEYAYQAEMWVQEAFGDEPSIVRAYAIIGGEVVVIWHKSPEGVISYVARNACWNGEWQLPFLYKETGIATARLPYEAITMNGAFQWAKEVLEGTCACAVFTDFSGVIAAWEKGANGLFLVARSPRAIP